MSVVYGPFTVKAVSGYGRTAWQVLAGGGHVIGRLNVEANAREVARLLNLASEASGDAGVVAHLRKCAVSATCSESDFNQGVVRGLEIAAAEIERRHHFASGIEARSDETRSGSAEGESPTGEAGDAPGPSQ